MSEASSAQEPLLQGQELTDTINSVFVLLCGFLSFLLHAGFGLLEVGSVREKNAKHIMLKNLMDAAVSAVAYWAFGYAFAYGTGNNPIIGLSNFFLTENDDYIHFFFQWVFSGTSATIVSGAVAERCRFRSYLIYSAFLSGIVYPIACHSVWNPEGFLYGKVVDYAGGGVVHLIGGAAAMSGAWILGARKGRFVRHTVTGKWQCVDIPGHNSVLAALGALVLWFGFLPFIAGAGYSVAGFTSLATTGRAVVVTILAGASGAISLLCFGLAKYRHWDLELAMNGLLAGIVASSSGANVYDTWIAVVVGLLGAVGFNLQVLLFEKVLRIDDPLNASALHMGAGITGMICVGFFANPDYTMDSSVNGAGIIYGGNGIQLARQVYGTCVYFLWSFGASSILFYGLHLVGWFRVSEEVEEMGMDFHCHNGSAYASENGKTITTEMTSPSNDSEDDIFVSTPSNSNQNASETNANDNIEVPAEDEKEKVSEEQSDVEEQPVPAPNRKYRLGASVRKRGVKPGVLLPGQA